MFSDRIVDFQFFVNFHRSGPAIIFSLSTQNLSGPHQDGQYSGKIIDVFDRIIDFQFFVNFHRSGPGIILSFCTIPEHVSYPSKKVLMKPRFTRTSSR